MLTVPLLEAAQLCQKDVYGVRRYNGKVCASTTRYVDGHRGACGCGPRNTDTPFTWNMQQFLTAPSERYFDNGGSSLWCGRNCGKCVKLTPTGETRLMAGHKSCHRWRAWRFFSSLHHFAFFFLSLSVFRPSLSLHPLHKHSVVWTQTW